MRLKPFWRVDTSATEPRHIGFWQLLGGGGLGGRVNRNHMPSSARKEMVFTMGNNALAHS